MKRKENRIYRFRRAISSAAGKLIHLLVFLILNGHIAQAAQDAKISPESIRAHHQALVDIASEAGGLDAGIRLNDAGRKAAQYLLAGYEEAGLKNVRFEEFYPNRW